MSRNTDEKNRRGENTQRMRRRSRNAEEEEECREHMRIETQRI